MPPKAKITKEMVIDAAFEVARKMGAENINARTVSKQLNCSTQPVMYHFATIHELKKAAYKKIDRFHTEYLMRVTKPGEDAMLGTGLNYIRFAVEETNLFQFLFQSGFAAQNSMIEMIDSEELKPILSIVQKSAEMNIDQTKEVMLSLALFVHGYASIIANNSLEFDETLVAAHLVRAYRGAVLAVQEEAGSKNPET